MSAYLALVGIGTLCAIVGTVVNVLTFARTTHKLRQGLTQATGDPRYVESAGPVERSAFALSMVGHKHSTQETKL